MNDLKLYEITEQFRALAALTDSDDLTDDQISDTITALIGSFEEKAIAVTKFVRNLDASADMIDDAARQMQARAARNRKRAYAVKNYLFANMLAAGVSKIECAEFRLAIRNNPVAVRILDGAHIPPEFMVQPPAPPPRADKAALKTALEGGQVIAGVTLERGQRLEIKI